MADMLTVTVGTTDYTFDWIDQHIHIEALVTEVTAADLKQAIHDAQDSEVGIPYPPIADFFNPVVLTASTSTFLNVVLREQWRIESFSASGTLVVGAGNVVNVNNGIDIFVANVLVNMVNNTSQAGVLVTGGGAGLSAQETRDAMKLAPTAGAPGAGSIDEHLDNVVPNLLFTSTVTGSPFFTGFVDTTQIGVGTKRWEGAEIEFTTGANIGLRRTITNFNDSFGSFSFLPQFQDNLVIGDEYKVIAATDVVNVGGQGGVNVEGWASQTVTTTLSRPNVNVQYVSGSLNAAQNQAVVFGFSQFSENYNQTRKAWVTNVEDFAGITAADPFNGQVVADSVTNHALSAQDIADIKNAVFNEIMEDSETFIQAIRLIRAEAAGNIGVAGTTHTVKSADGLQDRITATADETGRTVTSVDTS